MLFWNWLKKGLASKSIEATQLDSVDGLPGLACSPDLPAAFGFKTTWLAVRSTDADAVFDALRLQDKTCANWESGVSFAHSGGVTNGRVGVYVSPQIDGWTLVVTGHGFMTTSQENAQRVKDILQNLSRTFGECQYFGSHKVKGFCAWFKATDGKLERAFSLVGGQVFLNEGFADAAELDATPFDVSGLDNVGFQETLSEEDVDLQEDVPMTIAGAWSVNPLTLKRGRLDTGFAGCLNVSN